MAMNPYAWSLLGTALVAALVGGYVWRHRQTAPARAFPLLMFSLGWWSATYAMELACADLPSMQSWVIVEYPAIAASPVLWLIFTLQYAGKAERLSLWALTGLFAVPLLTVVLVGTNAFHHLFYRKVALDLSGVLPMQALTPGPAYWLHVAYSYFCLLAGTLILFSVWVASSHLYRRQAGIMLVGAAVPFAVNVLYLSGFRPLGNLDMTPFAFTVTGVFVAYGLFRYKLFDLLPLARSTLLENLRDGIIVADAEGRVVELNPAAAEEMGIRGKLPIGQEVSRVLAGQTELAALFELDTEGRREVPLPRSSRILEARYAPLRDGGGRRLGGLMVLRDITAAKQAEEAMRKGQERLELLLHSLPQAILVIDAGTHRILDANPQACLMIGLPADRIVGRTCHAFICPYEEGQCPVTDGGKCMDRSEGVLLTADGEEEIPVLKTVLAIEVEGEEWLIESISDISELKRAERERVEKQKLQALVETAGAVCHEMNQPLMAVSGYGELCLMDLDEDHAAYPQVGKILEQVRRMGEITRKLTGITNYKTKEYLDGRILDIDSSSEEDAGPSF